jgi:hypothetical protein
MPYCEDLETGDCLDSEYFDPDAPKSTSSQEDAFTLLSTAFVQFGKDALPSYMNYGDGGDSIIEWHTFFSYCVNITCWGDSRYEIYVFDRELLGHAWVPTTLVKNPTGTLVDAHAALQDYVAVLAAQRVSANANQLANP